MEACHEPVLIQLHKISLLELQKFLEMTKMEAKGEIRFRNNESYELSNLTRRGSLRMMGIQESK